MPVVAKGLTDPVQRAWGGAQRRARASKKSREFDSSCDYRVISRFARNSHRPTAVRVAPTLAVLLGARVWPIALGGKVAIGLAYHLALPGILTAVRVAFACSSLRLTARWRWRWRWRRGWWLALALPATTVSRAAVTVSPAGERKRATSDGAVLLALYEGREGEGEAGVL